MTTKYSKPVDDTDFWKTRLEHFSDKGLHRAVYDTSPEDMARIDGVHTKLLKKYGVGGKVLDAGCGYGRASQFIPHDVYVGLDFAPVFIQKAKQMYPDKIFQVQDLKSTDFVDKSFDWAVCISMKRMIVDNLGWDVWGQFETELRRISKAILILEYSTPEDHEVIYED